MECRGRLSLQMDLWPGQGALNKFETKKGSRRNFSVSLVFRLESQPRLLLFFRDHWVWIGRICFCRIWSINHSRVGCSGPWRVNIQVCENCGPSITCRRKAVDTERSDGDIANLGRHAFSCCQAGNNGFLGGSQGCGRYSCCHSSGINRGKVLCISLCSGCACSSCDICDVRDGDGGDDRDDRDDHQQLHQAEPAR
jgi:hypothetical protein